MLLHKHSLVDSIRHLHGNYNCSTYARGHKCIDYIFATTDILPMIKRGGIPPLDAVTSSDHRAVFIDIDVRSCLDSELSCLLRPPQRTLHSTHQRNRDKYISNLFQAFQRHKIFDRIKTLRTICYHQNQSLSEQLVESIDRDVTRLMIASENTLHKPSPVPFSSKLAQASLKVSILKVKYVSIKYGKNKDQIISRYCAKLLEPFHIPDNLQQVQHQLRVARNDVRSIRRNAVSERESFLLTKEQHCDNPSDLTKIIKRIRRAEEIKRGYTKLRYLLKPSQASLVTHIEIPTDDTPPKQASSWECITDPEEVTSRLFRRNVKHFGSAHGTPFTIPPLSTMYDWSAKSPYHHQTIQGNPPSTDDPLLSQLLSWLTSRVPPTNPTITMHELIRRLRRWKEATTTSPSRRHLGHYKALLPPTNYNLQDFLVEPEGQILSVHLHLLNFCATTGCSLRRWHKIITMMIPKEHHNFKIHRLRVIHIYEADLTALFSIWSKRMVHASTAASYLNQGSFGARPGRTSTDPAFIGLLQHEISAITRTNLAIAPNDASQCYDCIIPNHAMLSCISHGMPPSAATCIGSTLQNAKYYLRTAIQESTSFWCNTPSTPIYGTGQGSGISPGICCVTFSDMFDLHSTISTGAKYLSPVSPNTTTINNIGYVDDTTTTVCDHHLNSPLRTTHLTATLQTDLQNWSNILHLSGGALEFTKTELFILSWLFNSNGTPYLEDTTRSRITLTCPSTGSTHTIHASAPSSSYKLLGFHLSPSQSILKQYSVLRTKAHRIAYAVSGSAVTRREAFLAYFSIFLPAVSYILPLTTLTKQQCHRIHSKPTQIFLQKAGFPSTLNRHVVFGCRTSGGLGYRDLFVEQGVAHITKLIQTLRTPGQSKSLLLLLLNEWQISSGSSYPLLEIPTRPCKHLEGTWLLSTRTFLSDINASIPIVAMYCPCPLRLFDCAIMDAFNTIPGLGRKRLMHLNYCRLYLQIHFLSEITNTQGTHLLPGFWNGDPTSRPAPPLHRYPRQTSPSPAIWQLWRATIRKAFCHPMTTRLRRPLDLWFPTSYRRFPAVTYYPFRMWHSKSRFSSYLRTTLHGHVFSPSRLTGALNTNSIPVVNLQTVHFVTIIHPTPSPLPLAPRLPQLSSFNLLVDSAPSWKSRLLQHLSCSVTPSQLSTMLSNASPTLFSSFLAACDGSANVTTTFGWTLRQATTDLVTCYGPVDGHNANSYRAEATGLLSLLTFFDLLLSASCLQLPSNFPIYIDNRALCNQVHNHQSRLYYSPTEATASE